MILNIPFPSTGTGTSTGTSAGAGAGAGMDPIESNSLLRSYRDEDNLKSHCEPSSSSFAFTSSSSGVVVGVVGVVGGGNRLELLDDSRDYNASALNTQPNTLLESTNQNHNHNKSSVKIVEIENMYNNSPRRQHYPPLTNEREELIVNHKLEEIAQHYNQAFFFVFVFVFVFIFCFVFLNPTPTYTIDNFVTL